MTLLEMLFISYAEEHKGKFLNPSAVAQNNSFNLLWRFGWSSSSQLSPNQCNSKGTIIFFFQSVLSLIHFGILSLKFGRSQIDKVGPGTGFVFKPNIIFAYANAIRVNEVELQRADHQE